MKQGQAVVLGPGIFTYVLIASLAYQVFLMPSCPSPMRELPGGGLKALL